MPATAASQRPARDAGAQRSKAREAQDRALRRSRFAKAPISVGSTVTAPTATLATTIAEPTPMRPTNGIPVASRPAIATTTIAPAATTLSARRRVGHARAVLDGVARCASCSR